MLTAGACRFRPCADRILASSTCLRLPSLFTRLRAESLLATRRMLNQSRRAGTVRTAAVAVSLGREQSLVCCPMTDPVCRASPCAVCRHARLGQNALLKGFSDDVLKEIMRYLNTWDTRYNNWNVSLYPEHTAVDINGGHKSTVIASCAFRKGVHYWEITVSDMRTICVGVCEMPRNARSLGDRWLGEVGYAICSSMHSGGTAFLWSKDQLSTQTVKGFSAGTGQRIGCVSVCESLCVRAVLACVCMCARAGRG